MALSLSSDLVTSRFVVQEVAGTRASMTTAARAPRTRPRVINCSMSIMDPVRTVFSGLIRNALSAQRSRSAAPGAPPLIVPAPSKMRAPGVRCMALLGGASIRHPVRHTSPRRVTTTPFVRANRRRAPADRAASPPTVLSHLRHTRSRRGILGPLGYQPDTFCLATTSVTADAALTAALHRPGSESLTRQPGGHRGICAAQATTVASFSFATSPDTPDAARRRHRIRSTRRPFTPTAVLTAVEHVAHSPFVDRPTLRISGAPRGAPVAFFSKRRDARVRPLHAVDTHEGPLLRLLDDE